MGKTSFLNFRYRCEYFLVLALDIVIHFFPRKAALWIGSCLGLLVSWALPVRRRLVLENLSKAFPDKPMADIQAMARQCWKNIGRVAVEFVRMSDINSENAARFFSVEGLEHFQQAQAFGRGVILVGFHFTNWEMSGVASQYFFGNVMAVARPMKNPLVQNWVLKKRSLGQLEIILHRDAVRGCLKGLKLGKAVGILIDQNLYTGGVFARFFGRPAATTTLPALLQSRTQSPMLIVYVLRQGEGFKFIIEPVAAREGIQEQTQMLNDCLENIIRRHPENWFWVHNRWKRQP